MTNIEKIGNSLIFEKDDVQYVFPLNSLILISMMTPKWLTLG